MSCSGVPDDGGVGDCQELPWLCRQLAQMQNAMAEQHRLIDLHNAVISEQSHQIDQQTHMIDQQNRKIDQQNRKIDSQTRQIDQQNLQIAQLKTVNDKQNVEITQLKATNYEQEHKMTQQNQELSQLKSKLIKQDSAMQMLRAELVDLKTQKLYDESELVTLLSNNSNVSRSHDVVLRADDGGPLEAVVNQMSQQITTMNADIQALKNFDQQQDTNIQDARTSTYVRWGNSQCPADAQLVYSGLVGGSEHTQSGGGSNYLCLTMSPVFSSNNNAGGYAYLYGAEYETYDAHMQMDPVCAVCRSSHATTIMIPGTNVCTAGWTKQYDGFLMAEYISHHYRTEFVCVDSMMEQRLGSGADLNGALFYFTQAKCGSLPCTPYENNRVVTCVVCSK
jgi:hypothetical protein